MHLNRALRRLPREDKVRAGAVREAYVHTSCTDCDLDHDHQSDQRVDAGTWTRREDTKVKDQRERESDGDAHQRQRMVFACAEILTSDELSFLLARYSGVFACIKTCATFTERQLEMPAKKVLTTHQRACRSPTRNLSNPRT